jgi:hypothetical protein
LDDLISDIEGNGSQGNGTYLDCSALDPDKVYLVGTLTPSSTEADVIVSLDDPTLYCAGLTGSESGKITVSDNGYAIVISPNGVEATQVVQDALIRIPTPDDKGEWDFPTNLKDNDPVIAPMRAGAAGLFLKHDGSTDEIYYPEGPIGAIYSSETGDTAYFSNPDDLTFMGAMPNGTLLMYKDSSLYVIDTDLNQTALTPPDNGVYTFENTARSFTNAETGNQSAWILVQDSTFKNERRWSIDLVTLEVTDDGAFADAPSYVDLRTPVNDDDEPIRGKFKKLDGSGSLVQIAYYNAPPPGATNDITLNIHESLVIKRPIGSSSEESVILHSDAEYSGTYEWRKETWPTAHVFSGELLTGQ